jgi:hypothetical protein
VLSTLCGSSQVARNLHIPWHYLATSNAGDLDDLAVLLRLHSGLEGLARDIGHGDPNDDLRPALAGPVHHLRKTLASFGAQLFGRGALVGR